MHTLANTKDDRFMPDDSLTAPHQQVWIPGPTGQLEGLLSSPKNAVVRSQYIAVVCHPHPLYQGTMNNKVVHFLAKTFNEAGIPAIRFNFRGVQRSEGEYDQGQGETDDALAVIEWMRQRYPDAKLWLAGFSFGSYVALNASRSANPAGLVTVAPAVNLFDFRQLTLPNCPWLVVQGDNDEVVPSEDVHTWLEQIDTRPQIIRIKNADHFFHRRLNELRATVKYFLSRHLC